MWMPQAKAGRSLLFLLQQEFYSRNVPNSVGCFEDVFGEAEDPTEIAMTKKGSMFSGVNAVVLVEKAVQWSVAGEYQSSAIGCPILCNKNISKFLQVAMPARRSSCIP